MFPEFIKSDGVCLDVIFVKGPLRQPDKGNGHGKCGTGPHPDGEPLPSYCGICIVVERVNENHFYALLPAFMDARWIKIDGKLLFFVFRPNEIPNPREFTDTWRDLARKENLPDFHFVGSGYSTWNSLQKDGFDSTVFWRHRIIEQIEKKKIYKFPVNIYRRLQRKYRNKPAVFSYKKAMKYFLGNNGCKPYEYPCIIPNWDSTPRLGAEGVVLKDSTPELFRIHVKQTIKQISNRSFENRVVLLKSWNEWGEGNYIEPDSQFGRQYLEVLKDEITC